MKTNEPNQTTNIKIDHGIPIHHKHKLSPISEAILSCKQGDSFVVPKTSYQTVAMFAKRHGIRITTRKESSDSIRVWHVGNIEVASTPKQQL
jgi:hypothetical protein